MLMCPICKNNIQNYETEGFCEDCYYAIQDGGDAVVTMIKGLLSRCLSFELMLTNANRQIVEQAADWESATTAAHQHDKNRIAEREAKNERYLPMKNLIFDDRWQSEGQGDKPSGTGGSDNRCRVSWNKLCHTDDDGGRYGGSSSDADDLEKIARS